MGTPCQGLFLRAKAQTKRRSLWEASARCRLLVK